MTLPFNAISRSDPLPAGAPRLERTSGATRIAFKHTGGKTRLDRLYQEGAAKVRLPRTFSETPTAVLINTAGGLTGGDRMSAEVSIAAGCHAIVTTQACEKIYRASEGDAEIRATLRLGAGARLDWLPQETILFDRARLSRRLDAELEADAELLLVEATILGRAAHGETVTAGLFRDRWRIRRNGRLLFADDLRFDWNEEVLAGPATLANAGAMATLLFVTQEPDRHLDALRAVVGAAGGVSAFGGKLIARIATPDGVALRRILIPAIACLRDGASLPSLWRI